MKKSIALALLLIAAALVAWQSQDSRELTKARIPDFPLRALASAGATRANFFVSRDGTISRYAIHVGAESLPEWVSKAADERIGKGEDLEYEVELYPDGSEVFEIYRRIDGRERQISVHASDRSVKYLGKQLEESELPERVGATLRGIKGFLPEKIIFKEGPKFAEVHVRGRIGGVPHRVRISGDGRLLAVQKKVPAEIELAVQE